jgi:4-hydroxybenzoate polyprenyltransferase
MGSIPTSEPQFPKISKSDFHENPWVIRYTPARVHPFIYLIRLDRPIGTWLLLLPCLWGITLGYHMSTAPNIYHTLWMMILFCAGSIIMRSAGCIINDLWDRDLDGKVERTKSRPLVTGTVKVYEAYALLLILLFLGFLILTQINISVTLLGFLAVPLVILYPLMKRITYVPQFILGLTFNFGALMGYASITNDLQMPALYLYAAGICWTIGYDTLYAHMDKEDDAKIGVKSTALLFGNNSRYIIALFYAGTIFLTMAALWDITPIWRIVLFALILTGLFGNQIIEMDINNPSLCLNQFRANRNIGLFIWILMILCGL